MNVFALITRKRTTMKIVVPRETLWERTNRYHQNAVMSAKPPVEGIAKTAGDVVHPDRRERRVSAAPAAHSLVEKAR